MQLTSWPCTCLRSSPWDRTCEPPPERGLPQAPRWEELSSPLFWLLLSSFTNMLARCLLSPSVSTKVNPGLKWSALLYGSSYNSLSTDVHWCCLCKPLGQCYLQDVFNPPSPCSVPKWKRPSSQPLTLIGRGSLIRCFRNPGIVKRGGGGSYPMPKNYWWIW